MLTLSIGTELELSDERPRAMEGVDPSANLKTREAHASPSVCSKEV
jgi:hypothetical protein